MSISIEALIRAASSYIEDMTTRDNLTQNLRAIGLQDADQEVFKQSGNGKRKYSESLLRERELDELKAISIRLLDRFSGIEDERGSRSQLEELLKPVKIESVKLYFAGNGKPDIIVKDLTRGTLEVLDYKGCLELSASSLDTVSWESLLDSQAGSFSSMTDLLKYLSASIPVTSPQARRFFDSYVAQTCRLGNYSAPALLPELYLHYDPMTKKFRGGAKAIQSQRCDFYIKIANREIIIEVDGIQHYALKDGRADMAGYSRQCAWDRDRLLSGYEIYRFGTGEFVPGFENEMRSFMKSLVAKSGINI